MLPLQETPPHGFQRPRRCGRAQSRRRGRGPRPRRRRARRAAGRDRRLARRPGRRGREEDAPARSRASPPGAASRCPTWSRRPTRSAPTTARTWACPASTRSPAASSRRCTAAGSGRCACSPASARRSRPTRASSTCSREGQTGLSTAFDFPTLMGYDSDSPRALGEVGMCGVAVDTLRDMEVLFDGIPLDKVTTSMTINGPAIVLLAFYVALADKRGIPRRLIGGTVQNDCLKEFIAQHAWLVPPRPAMRIVTDMIEFCAPRGAAVELGVDQRLPHPRGRLDRRAGARVHPRRRPRLRGELPRARARRRRVRPAAQLLLRRAQRLLRGDRQAPRRAPDVGPLHEGALRREEGREHEAPHPRADRRRLAHRAAAVQQRRARRAPGARRGARRHAVAPHQLARRDLRPAHRGERHHRPSHPADHRPRERRRRTPSTRSAAATSSSG